MAGPEQIQSTIRRYIAAFNARDLDTLVSLYAADARVEDPIGSPPHQGADEIRAFYERFRNHRSSLHLTGEIRAAESAAAFSFMVIMGQEPDTQIVEVTDTFAFDSSGRIKEMRAFWGVGNVHHLNSMTREFRKRLPLSMVGRVALVTGGGSGMGQAAAVEFARQGASVVVAGRREEPCRQTLKMIQSLGGQGLAIATDVTIESQVEALVAATLAKYARLDYVSNTAGWAHAPTFLIDTSLEQYEAAQAANARGVFLCMKHQIRAMLKAGHGGAIVNVTSDAAFGGFPLYSDYAAAKHAATGLTRSAALEYAKDGIRINSLAPGPISTPMLKEADAESLRPLVPAGRIGTPQEVADAIVWLCSEQASFIYGQVLQVDGALGGVSCVAQGLPIPPRVDRTGAGKDPLSV